MKIGIDARFLGPQGTGIGKYVEKLIENLQKIDSKNSYSIFLNESNWSFLKISNNNFRKILADVSWYSLEEQLKMSAICNAQKLDLLHVPHFNVPILYKGKFVVTIHDLIHLNFPQTSTTTKNFITFHAKRIGYKKVLKNAIHKSQKIFTPSIFVKNEIINKFNIHSSKIVVTYESAEDEYFSPQPPARNTKQSLLYVGNAYPHKNLENLLKAMKILKDVQLHIVSPRDIFSQRLEKLIATYGLESRVKLYGYQGTDSLLKMFHSLSAYVFPSLSEGFGIPPLNAMASHMPVISAQIPTLKEICGEAAIYFDPYDSTDIASKINKVLKSRKTREDLIKKGNIQVKKYSWQKMAKETLSVYEQKG